jgi:hypothetical protein
LNCTPDLSGLYRQIASAGCFSPISVKALWFQHMNLTRDILVSKTYTAVEFSVAP